MQRWRISVASEPVATTLSMFCRLLFVLYFSNDIAFPSVGAKVDTLVASNSHISCRSTSLDGVIPTCVLSPWWKLFNSTAWVSGSWNISRNHAWNSRRHQGTSLPVYFGQRGNWSNGTGSTSDSRNPSINHVGTTSGWRPPWLKTVESCCVRLRLVDSIEKHRGKHCKPPWNTTSGFLLSRWRMLELDWVNVRNVRQSESIENSMWETLITTQEQHFRVATSMVEKDRIRPNSLFQYREQL